MKRFIFNSIIFFLFQSISFLSFADTPIAINDTINFTICNNVVLINPLANDTYLCSDSDVNIIDSPFLYTNILKNADNSFTYTTPYINMYYGQTDSIRYTITCEGISDTAKIYIKYPDNYGTFIDYENHIDKQCVLKGNHVTDSITIRNNCSNEMYVELYLYYYNVRVTSILDSSQFVSSSGISILFDYTDPTYRYLYLKMDANAELKMNAYYTVEDIVNGFNGVSTFASILFQGDGFDVNEDISICANRPDTISTCESPKELDLSDVNASSYLITKPAQISGSTATLSATGIFTYYPGSVTDIVSDTVEYTVNKTDGSFINGQIYVTILPCFGNIKTAVTQNESCNKDSCVYNGPSILINEVMTTPKYYNGAIFGQHCIPSDLVGGEWVELYNPDKCNSVDISGYFFANATSDQTGSACALTRNLGAAFVLPEGTVIPPMGFCILRGEHAQIVDSARLIENGGNTAVINLIEHFDRFCMNNNGVRFWLPDAGGWFGFYNRQGVPQDAIYWGPVASDICTDCLPCNPLIPTTFNGQLASLDDFPAARKTRITDFDIGPYVGNSPKRQPDGGNWVYNSLTPPKEGFCNGDCNHRDDSECTGTASVSVSGGSEQFSYQWDDSWKQTTPTAIGLCEGTYYCTITDKETKLQKLVAVKVTNNTIKCANYPDNIKEVICFKTELDTQAWGIRLAQSSETTVDEIYTPLSGDLDGNSIPEIVVTQGDSNGTDYGKIQVFEGDDLSQYSTTINLNDSIDSHSGAHIALVRLADETNPSDTLGLIIVHTKTGLVSYHYQDINTISLFKTYTGTIPSGPIGLADFNHDGKPEIYCGDMVFDAYSLNLIGKGNSNTGAGFFDTSTQSISYAADILPNIWGTELICGSVIYSVDVDNNAVNIAKTITPPTGFTSDGQTSLADFDGDGLLDVLVKQDSSDFGIYAYNPRTEMILFSQSIFPTGYQNYPAVGDIDGDGKPEIVLSYENVMKAYKYDGSAINEFWSLPISNPAGSTGVTLFDFNQDGIQEIIYRDEVNLQIINGSKKSHLTGTDTIVYNLANYPIASKTIVEHPIVVDCDADGEAEIVLSGKANGDTISKLHVFKSLIPKTWAAARPVWNQYAYNVTNVNKDLTIPTRIFNNASFFPNGKQAFNNFQQQVAIINLNGDPVFELLLDTIYSTDTICEGDIYIFGGDTLNTSGTYTYIPRCDSILILDFTVKPRASTNIEYSVCLGETFFFNNETLASSGIYKDTLTSFNGCDSIITLTFNAYPVDTTYIYASIGEGETYLFDGKSLTTEGIYNDTLQNIASCDSIVILNLTVILDKELGIPQGFSPNNDGVNDFFVIQHLEYYPDNHILIFNRWGDKVFEANPYENNWDGRNYFGVTVGGNLLPVGTYFYLLDLGDGSDVKKGFIFLNR